MSTKYDFALIKHEFVTSDLTLRALGAQHSVKGWSTLYERARRENWELERKRYREKQFEASIDAIIARRATKMAELQEDIIDALRGALTRMLINMQSDEYIVTPDHLFKLIQATQLITGGPTSREEVNAFNVDLPADLLRELQATARGMGSGPKPVGQSALPLLAGPRQVNGRLD
jgi:hypothetical protein